VSTTTPELIRTCRRCSSDLPPTALVCHRCQALVHSEELDRIALAAKDLEARRDFRQAGERWRSALPLLPPTSRQADWIQSHARDLDAMEDRFQTTPPSENKWAEKLGPVGPIAVLLAKGKLLLTAVLKLKFLLSFVAFFGFYWAAFGARFGIGFAILVFIHEMGHFIDIKRRGLPAEMPVFLPGFGAYVRWQAAGVPLEVQAEVSLAGPFAGFLAAVVCAVIWSRTGSPLWAALARSGAWLNLLNLIPVWMLDGGHAALALSKAQRFILLMASLAFWLFFNENLFFLVAVGAAYQAFWARDLPAQTNRTTIVYFVVVLAALGLVMGLLPGQGVGLN
jgi:Zn-dependent protease